MLLALWLVALSAAPVVAQDRVAVTPVTVVDVTDGSLLRDHTVLVEGERIAAVGPAGHLAPEVYRAIIDEARKVGLPVAGHIPLQVRALEAARAGQRTNEHLHQIREACTPIEDGLIGERRRFYDGSYEPEQEYALLDAQVHRAAAAYDEATCERVARDLAESEQWQVPTLVNERRWFLGVPRERLQNSRLAYLPAAERAAWERRHDAGDLTYGGDSLSLRRGWQATKRVVEVLGRSGVGLLVGTDFGNPFVFPGASVHEEMELLVESGLTPLAAFQAATSEAAAFMHATDDHGSVAPGKRADLVLLDANPLADITNTRRIAAVVLDGRYLDRAALDRLLTEAERSATADSGCRSIAGTTTGRGGSGGRSGTT